MVASKSDYIWRVLSLAFVLLVGMILYQQALYSPYYHAWDMDLSTIEDVIRINSGDFPLHINHPAFGMYLIQSLAVKFLSWLDLASVLSHSEMRAAFNPLLYVAQSYYVLSMVNAIVICLMISLPSIILRLCYHTSEYLNFLSLVAMSLMGFVWGFNGILIRSETYACLYLILTFGFLLRASHFEWEVKKKTFYIYLFVSCMFAGLTLLTKIQSLIILAAMILLPFYYIPSGKIRDLFSFKVQWRIALSLFLLLLFWGLKLIAKDLPMDQNFAIFGSVKGNNLLKIILSIAGFGVILNMALLFIKLPRYERIFSHLHTAIVIVLILSCSSFLFHFLIYPDFFKSLQYLFYDFLVLFVRKNNYTSLAGEVNYFIRAYQNLVMHKVVAIFIFTPAILSTVILLGRREWKKIVVSSLIIFFLLVNVGVGVRLSFQDSLWVECSYFLFGLFFWGSLGKMLEENNFFLNKNFILSLSLLPLMYFSYQKNAHLIAKRYQKAGYFKSYMFTKTTYGKKDDPYTKVIESKLLSKKTLRYAIEQSRNYHWINGMITSIFPTNNKLLGGVGVNTGQGALFNKEVISPPASYANDFLIFNHLFINKDKYNLFLRRDVEHILLSNTVGKGLWGSCKGAEVNGFLYNGKPVRALRIDDVSQSGKCLLQKGQGNTFSFLRYVVK